MKLLPQFPLQLVVYPGEELNLHIFEPRYRQLINECDETGMKFGIPAYINGEVMTVGTEMELVKVVKRFSSGEMDIKTRALGCYKVENFLKKAPNKLYAAAEYDYLENDYSINEEMSLLVHENITKLYQLLETKKKLPIVANKVLSYEVAHHIGLNVQQEYHILTLLDEYARMEYILQHLMKILPVVEEAENLRRKVQMNGHFKNVLPPDFG